MVTILISATFGCAGLISGKALINGAYFNVVTQRCTAY